MKTVLIIGADSFIASNFIDSYQDKYIFLLISREKMNFDNELLLNDFFQIPDNYFENADVVINFSAIVHAKRNIKKELYYEINHKLAVQNAIKAKKNGVGQFIQMSTIAVYGQANYIDNNIKEKPINDYGHSKLLADNELRKLENDIFKVAIIRPAMVYGGGNAPGNMMRLIRLVDKGIPLPFKGLKNNRCFLHIRNLMIYIQQAIEMELNGTILASDSKGISTYELINIISEHLGRKNIQFKIPFFFINLLEYFNPRIINKLFGSLVIYRNDSYEKIRIQSKYTVEQGIEQMVKWYLEKKTM